MAKRTGQKLYPLALRKKPPGMHGDGLGLWLQVTPSGARTWIFRFTRGGRTRDMGLGPLHAVPIARARDKAAEARQMLAEGLDPIDARQARLAQQKASEASVMTFQQCAEGYLAGRAHEWRNEKHREQWTNTLVTYVYPKIGGMSVADIEAEHIADLLQPIWTEKHETASRVRGRIESVLAYATVRKRRSGENPARWKGNLDQILPKPKKVKTVEHHPALPYQDIPQFMADLRGQRGTSARALELAILTATRTSEVLGARWDEFDLTTAVWTIPAGRMKAGKAHTVPLADRTIELLKTLVGGDGFVFRGRKDGEPLSNMSMLAVLKRMGRPDLTTHGFRSTFRDWAAEETNHPAFVAEMALAHTIRDKVEKAYRRGDLFVKRAALMRDWATFCHRDPNHKAAVLPLRTKSVA